ncbi:MAG TPA: hypothetical protein VD929_04335 [Caulobacteraceae bacterium]|nr:hypothetical protein [Caulobacteraceae bacterium]
MATTYKTGVSKAKANTTAETLRWSENEMLWGPAIKKIFVDMAPTDNDMDALTKIELFAAGNPIWRLNELQFNAVMSTLAKREVAGATVKRFTIDFSLFGMVDGGCAPNKALSLEITTDNTGANGTWRIGYEVSDAPGKAYPTLLAQDMNIGASAAPGTYTFTQRGLLRGFVLPRTTSIDQLQLWDSGGNQIWTLNTEGLILQAQDYISGFSTTLNKLFLLPEPFMLPGGRVELTVDGSFVATDQIVPWVDQPVEA